MDISKFFAKSEIVELLRSQIHLAEYNPRTITQEGKKALRKSIKKFGVLGGIIVNKQTDYTIVGGHQKVLILDDENHYDEDTQENDYLLRVEIIDVDEQTEKTLNVALNNPTIGGQWDYDKLRELIPDIDYKGAGLTEADLSMIGVDALFQTEEETNLTAELDAMMFEVNEEHNAEVEARKEMRQAQREMERAQKEAEKTQEERTQHMKDVKREVAEKAMKDASDMEAYLMLSFDNWENKVYFCQQWGLDPNQKFIKGEDLQHRIDGIEEDEEYEDTDN